MDVTEVDSEIDQELFLRETDESNEANQCVANTHKNSHHKDTAMQHSLSDGNNDDSLSQISVSEQLNKTQSLPPCSEQKNEHESKSSEEIEVDIRGSAGPRFELNLGQQVFEVNSNNEDLVFEEYSGDKFNDFDELEQSDRLLEEITVEDPSSKYQGHMDDMRSAVLLSAGTTTDYRTICEEFQSKVYNLEKELHERENLITTQNDCLQRVQNDYKNIQEHNNILYAMIDLLQQKCGDTFSSFNELHKENLSDFMRHENTMHGENMCMKEKLIHNLEKDHNRDNEPTVSESETDFAKEKISFHCQKLNNTKKTHEKEVSHLKLCFEDQKCDDKVESSPRHTDKSNYKAAEFRNGSNSNSPTKGWRDRRNSTFDKNRQLEEVTKERDGFKKMTSSLQHILAYLIQYFNDCENELNKTVVADVGIAATMLDITVDSNVTTNSSLGEKRVHITPDISSILAEDIFEQFCGEGQRDISLEVRKELEVSLNRLKQEADEILKLSTRVSAARNEALAISDKEDKRDESCSYCRAHKDEIEASVKDTLERELTLQRELESTKLKLSLLTAETNDEVLFGEGLGAEVPIYGKRIGGAHSWSPRSLDSPRLRCMNELEVVTRERDDLLKQLDVANKYLRSTRCFIDEQTNEREHEREEHTAQMKTVCEQLQALRSKIKQADFESEHVEELENQFKDASTKMVELENKNKELNNELSAANEKVTVLRDMVTNLDLQLEAKCLREEEILKQVKTLESTLEERDAKLRYLVEELKRTKDVECEPEQKPISPIKSSHCIESQMCKIKAYLTAHASKLERAAVQTFSSSSHSEELSPGNHHKSVEEENHCPPALEGPLADLSNALKAVWRSESVAVKTLADYKNTLLALNEVTQELRAERDVLESRLSEQALRISELSTRVERQRHSAKALRDEATAELAVQLHDALAEKERILSLGLIRGPQHEQVLSLQILLQQSRSQLALLQQQIKEKDRYIKDILSLDLKDGNRSEITFNTNEGCKHSGRTLSDIISLSDFDEQDLQMRRNNLKLHGMSLDSVLFPQIEENNKTLPPKGQSTFIMNKSSLDHLDLASSLKIADVKSKELNECLQPSGADMHDDDSLVSYKNPHSMLDQKDHSKYQLDTTELIDAVEELNLEPDDRADIVELLSQLNRNHDRDFCSKIPKTYSNQLDTVQNTAKVLKECLERMLRYFKKIKQTFEAQTDAFQNIREDSQVARCDLQLARECLLLHENTIKELSENNQLLKSNNIELKDECKTLKQDLFEKAMLLETQSILENTLTELQNKLDSQTGLLGGLEEKIIKLSNEKDEALSSKERLIERIGNLEKSLRNTELKYSNALNEIDSLSIELKEALEKTKHLAEQVQDRDCHIQILNEDSLAFHEQLDSLRQQLNGEQAESPIRNTESPRRCRSDKKEIAKIRKQITFMQQELSYNKKLLNEKVFELEKLKLDANEVRIALSHSQRRIQEQDEIISNGEQMHLKLQDKIKAMEEIHQQCAGLIRVLEEDKSDKEKDLRVQLDLNIEQLHQREKLLDELHNQVQELEEENAALRRKTTVSYHEHSQPGITTVRSSSLSQELEHSLRKELSASKRLDTSLALLLSPKHKHVESDGLLVSKLTFGDSYTSPASLISLPHCEVVSEGGVAYLNNIIGENERLASENERLANECVRVSCERDRLQTEKERLMEFLRHQEEDQKAIGILHERLEASMENERQLRDELTRRRSTLIALEAYDENQYSANYGLKQTKLNTQIQYLHSRCLRLESCRKALIWQKRYLIKYLDGFVKIEEKLGLPHTPPRKTFKFVAICVLAFVRMGFLVRRHRSVRILSRKTLFPS